MEDAGILVPIVVPLGLFAMIFGIIYLRNRERMAMIERGMNPKIDLPQPHANLKWGLLLIGSGIGLLLSYFLDKYAFPSDGDQNVAIYFALIAIFGGLGLYRSYQIDMKYLSQQGRD